MEHIKMPTEEKAKKEKKVKVYVLRLCSDEQGNLYDEGDTPEFSKELAQKFLDSGVIKLTL